MPKKSMQAMQMTHTSLF